jgi:ribulose 1,5-bisphosphate carboxylase large subunit-like protein
VSFEKFYELLDFKFPKEFLDQFERENFCVLGDRFLEDKLYLPILMEELKKVEIAYY